MRDTNKAKNILEKDTKDDLPLKVIQLDVNDDSSVKQAIQTILKEDECIDVLVNNAGFAVLEAVEDTSFDEAKEQFETNFFSLYQVIQSVLPTMRKQRSGTIINISSTVGLVGFPGASAYTSTKFAVEGFSESLKAELEPFVINVAIVEPALNLLDNAFNLRKGAI
jgi:short-subunit dehydrogenase